MIRRGLLAVLALGLGAATAGAATPVERLAEANAAYGAGRFEEARAGYLAVVDADIHHESVYYNLGCASARLGHDGEAILAFRRALRYEPGHEDALANLAWVRARAGEADPPPTSARVLLARATALFAPDLGLWAGLLASYAAGLLALVVLVRGGRRTLYAAALAALIAALLLAPALVQVWLRASEHGAVVVQPRVEARSGPSDAHPTLFSAHEGLELRILETRGAWVRASAPSGPSGWLPCDSLGSVAPERLSCAGERSGEAPSLR